MNTTGRMCVYDPNLKIALRHRIWSFIRRPFLRFLPRKRTKCFSCSFYIYIKRDAVNWTCSCCGAEFALIYIGRVNMMDGTLNCKPVRRR